MDFKLPSKLTNALDCLCPPPNIIECECCSEGEKDLCLDECQDIKEVTISDVKLNCEGRLLKVNIELHRVCAGRKLALGVLLYEKHCSSTFYLKGFRACEVEIPHSRGTCKDHVLVKEFCFILPEEDICSKRKLQLKVVAHYSSFPCNFPCP